MKKNFSFLISLLLLLISCAAKNSLKLKSENFKLQNYIFLSTGDISAVFVDNTAFGENHKAGYNGIAEINNSSSNLIFGGCNEKINHHCCINYVYSACCFS